MMTVRILCGALALVAMPGHACEGLEVSEARVMESPPGASVLAGFATLRNAGDAPLVIRRSDSPDFSAVEFHSLVRRDGLIRMTVDGSLTVPPHGTLAIKSGERHLMLIRPARDFHEGDCVSVRLHCSTGTLDVKMPVEKSG
ncbi:MAG: copper chaperone PCu(A)C [Pseudomonadota bacterium]